MNQIPVLAIDASNYAIRAVVSERTHFLDCFEDRPHNDQNLITFLRDWREQYPTISVVASPLDRWPQCMEKQIERSGITIEWLSPELMRGVVRTLAPWNKKRRLHRAGLLAYLAAHSRSSWICPSARELTLSWEAYMARETIDGVNAELCPCPDEGFSE
jgi:hypothetical protein